MIAGLKQNPEQWRDLALVLLAGLVMAACWSLIPGALAGTVYELELIQLAPEVWLYLRIDALGVFFAVIISSLWLLALIYSQGYLGPDRRNRYYLVLMLSLGLALGVAWAGNLLTLLVFYELLSIMACLLVVHEETPAAKAAATKYIVYILVGGSLILVGVVLVFHLVGSLAFSVTPLLHDGIERGYLVAVFVFLIAGFGVKAALVPLHGWVPDAHPAAPAPFSALLSGVLVATGAFGIIRVVLQVFGVELLARLGFMHWVSLLATVGVLAAGLAAMRQDNLKRRLAYSTISQMGYITLAVSLLGREAIIGALVHIGNHAFMKTTLFFCAGLLMRQAGIQRVSEMGGIARNLPLTMGAFAVAALGLIGVPPLAGFVSKWLLGTGALEAGWPVYMAVFLGGSLLTAFYLLPILYVAYFKEPPMVAGAEERRVTEAGAWRMLVPTLIAAACTVGLGVAATAPGMPLELARAAVAPFWP